MNCYGRVRFFVLYVVFSITANDQQVSDIKSLGDEVILPNSDICLMLDF